VEAEAKRDAKKAKIEKSREIFFEYEAKMAEQTEARIEAAEKQAELEAEADKQLVAELESKEKQAEKDAALATSKKEKAAKEKEARVSHIEVQLIHLRLLSVSCSTNVNPTHVPSGAPQKRKGSSTKREEGRTLGECVSSRRGNGKEDSAKERGTCACCEYGCVVVLKFLLSILVNG